MESYSERLEREIKELQLKYPSLEKMMKDIKKAYFMSNSEIDYEIEKDAMAYNAAKVFIELIKPPCEHRWYRTTKNYKRIKKCFECGEIKDVQPKNDMQCGVGKNNI